MTKAAVCLACNDIVSPRRAWRTDRSWRWCECEQTGVRWHNGELGQLEVTSLHGPDGARVLGINNGYLLAATAAPHAAPSTWWRDLHHASTASVATHYLFHERQRCCWALVVRLGETSDVRYVPYAEATASQPPLVAQPDRAAAS